MAGILGLVGPALGATSGLASLFGGTPAQNVQLPPSWQMPGMDQAAGGAMGGINQLLGMNVPQQLLPAYQGVAGNLMNNPGAPGAMQGSQNAQGYGNQAAGQAAGSGNYLSMLGAGTTPYAMGIMNAGFDPQNALYGRSSFNAQQGARAGNEARGIDMTPYGAGLENDAMRNFNIDWQNQQLQRMVTGAQGAGGLMNTGANLMTQGQGLSNMAPGLAQQAGMAPYSTFNQIGGDQLNALNALSQAGTNATQIPQQGVQNWLQYLGAGNQAAGVANQTAQLGLNQANLGFNQSQQVGNQIGQSFAGLGQGLNRMYGWGQPSSGGGSPGYYGGSPSTNSNLSWG